MQRKFSGAAEFALSAGPELYKSLNHQLLLDGDGQYSQGWQCCREHGTALSTADRDFNNETRLGNKYFKGSGKYYEEYGKQFLRVDEGQH